MRSLTVSELSGFLHGSDVVHIFDDRDRLIFRGLAAHDFVYVHYWYFVREFQWKSPGLAYIYLTGEVFKLAEDSSLD